MAMDKDIFSKEQEQQILKALDAMDGELGIDKLNDEEGLRAIFSKYPERQKHQESGRTFSIQSLRLYLAAAFSGGAAIAGLAVAIIPSLLIPTLTSQRGPNSHSENQAVTQVGMTTSPAQSEKSDTRKFTVPNFPSKTDLRVPLRSDDPQDLRLELVDMATRAGLSVGTFPLSEGKILLNLYGLDRNNVDHIPIWAKLGAPLSDHKNITVEISR